MRSIGKVTLNGLLLLALLFFPGISSRAAASRGASTLPAAPSTDVTGATPLSRYGPQHHAPAEGIPVHAYSPFDERNNREYPCPAGGCQTMAGYVLLKLEPWIAAGRKALTNNVTLNRALSAQGVVRLEPIFPAARAPQPGARLATPAGDLMPVPDLTRWQRAYLDEKADLAAAVEAIGQFPGIVWAEPDYLRKPAADSEWASVAGSQPPVSRSRQPVASFADSLYVQQWHLGATGVISAWQWLADNGYAAGGSRDVVVAVIDTGVDYIHPDLAANVWINAIEFSGAPGVDDDGNGYVDDIHGADTVTPDGDPQDDHGHGTHVAGIIAAQAGNGVGGVGVAYNVQIMAVKAAQYSGVLAASDIAEAVYYAVDKGADVINMSFGGYARSQVEEDALAVAFGQAVLVAAAGNDGRANLPCNFGRDMYPAAYNWVLGVMARTPYPDAEGDYLAGFSNYDCAARDTHEYELMAPGTDIWSTLPNAQYAAWAGTSMAAPVVSGIAALARTRWSDKEVYSSRFIMGQLATTGPTLQAYTPMGGTSVSYLTPDALAVLTTSPQPELAYLQHWLFDTHDLDPINDNDGIVDAGETVDLAITVRNHWGKAEPVTATLAAWAEGAFQPDPYVTLITDTVNYGAIGAFNGDDNGLLYENDVIVGVEHPFCFTTDPNTPNDHLIPFRLTITARNGYDPADLTLYTFTSRFYLSVQRGRELPAIIAEDMTLSAEHYWIMAHPTLIEAGVSVTITAGTQIQFGTADSDAYLQVEGALQINGTEDAPVVLKGSELRDTRRVTILNYGTASASYIHVTNPQLGYRWSNGLGAIRAPLTHIDHAYFETDRLMGREDPWGVSAALLTNSIFHKLQSSCSGYAGCGIPSGLLGQMTINTILLDSPQISSLYRNFILGWPDFGISGPMSNSVFLQDNAQNIPMRWYYSGISSYNLTNNYFNNVLLSKFWDPDFNHWMRVEVAPGIPRDTVFPLANNYWGTTTIALIEAMIIDNQDDFNLAHIVYQPILATPPETAYPFVADVILSTSVDPDATVVGAEVVTFTVAFNRDMDTAIQPAVSFGPAEPYTDYTVRGDWTDARTWQGTYLVTPVTGDGYQLIRVAGAVAADDAWLVTGNDAGRFRFEVETSGTAAMNLQASGGEGYVDLMWTQTDFDLLAGFNLYRATAVDGVYTRLNASLIPPEQRAWRDTDVLPGQPYYYKFTVVKTDMTESDFSNVATATPIDTIAPVIDHTPVTSAPPGLALTLNADVTDNVAVQSVTLFYRALGGTIYSSRALVKTTGNRYAATLEGSLLVSPGLEYYIQASDGINLTRSGRPDYPYQIIVVDRPVVTVVTPNHGPAGGGTPVTLSGSNFKAGATVAFGGAAASNVIVINSNQITCTTPPHFPEHVDVTVTNPDAQSGTLLRGYTYQADVASLGLPHTGGGQHAIVQIPVNLANVTGLAAVSLTVTFDPAVLSAQGATAGNLTPGWSVVANTATPGEIRLSLASSGGPVSGSGVLALIQFDVMGAAGASSALHPTAISLNDGAIPVESADGSFTVDLVYNISGAIPFWNGAIVSGTLLTLTGDRLYTGLSGATGGYTVAHVPVDDYTLVPSKSDAVNGISAYDASLALQHDAGLTMLSGHAFTAADVNRSGAVTAMDAYYILQKAVDLIALPFPGAGRVWDFAPQSRSYTNLSSNLTGQDFTAILLGDPSGNWTPAGRIARILANGSAILRVQDATPDATGVVTAALWLDPQGSAVYSVDLMLAYDGSALTVETVALGGLAEEWLLVSNLNLPGEAHIALAGAHALTDPGKLLTLRLTLAQDVAETVITPLQGALNEGAIPATLVAGRVNRQRVVYLPLVLRGK